MSKELKYAVKEFLEILDTKEKTEKGRIFNPIHISSVRVLLTVRLEKCLEIMKREISKE